MTKPDNANSTPRAESRTTAVAPNTSWEERPLEPVGSEEEKAVLSREHPTLGSLKGVEWKELTRSISHSTSIEVLRQLDQAGGRLRNGEVSELEIPNVGTVKLCDIEGLNAATIKALGEGPLFGMTGEYAYDPERLYHTLSACGKAIRVRVNPHHVLEQATATILRKQQEQRRADREFAAQAREDGTPTAPPRSLRAAPHRPGPRREALVLAASSSDDTPGEPRVAAPSPLGGRSGDVHDEQLNVGEVGSQDETMGGVETPWTADEPVNASNIEDFYLDGGF